MYKRQYLTLPYLTQVEAEGSSYAWDAEMVRYGPLDTSIGRASDDPDSDLEDRDEDLKRRAKGKNRKTLKAYVGREWLFRQQEIARYEARRRPDWDEAAFDASYPEYQFDFSGSDEYVLSGVSHGHGICLFIYLFISYLTYLYLIASTKLTFT